MIALVHAIIRLVTHHGPATLTTRDCWLLCPDDDTRGHVPGDYDCPCGPFVSTDVEAGVRVVRHVAIQGMSGESGAMSEFGTSEHVCSPEGWSGWHCPDCGTYWYLDLSYTGPGYTNPVYTWVRDGD